MSVFGSLRVFVHHDGVGKTQLYLSIMVAFYFTVEMSFNWQKMSSVSQDVC